MDEGSRVWTWVEEVDSEGSKLIKSVTKERRMSLGSDKRNEGRSRSYPLESSAARGTEKTWDRAVNLNVSDTVLWSFRTCFQLKLDGLFLFSSFLLFPLLYFPFLLSLSLVFPSISLSPVFSHFPRVLPPSFSFLPSLIFLPVSLSSSLLHFLHAPFFLTFSSLPPSLLPLFLISFTSPFSLSSFILSFSPSLLCFPHLLPFPPSLPLTHRRLRLQYIFIAQS